MKKKKIIIFLFVLLFISCTILVFEMCNRNVKGDKFKYYKYVNNHKNIYKHFEHAKLLYYNDNIGGIDTHGLMYFVYSFEEQPDEFLKDQTFRKEKNEEFEKKVELLLDTFYSKEYEELLEEYKIDWQHGYYYTNDCEHFVSRPMIYYYESKKLIMLYLYD